MNIVMDVKKIDYKDIIDFNESNKISSARNIEPLLNQLNIDIHRYFTNIETIIDELSKVNYQTDKVDMKKNINRIKDMLVELKSNWKKIRMTERNSALDERIQELKSWREYYQKILNDKSHIAKTINNTLTYYAKNNPGKDPRKIVTESSILNTRRKNIQAEMEQITKEINTSEQRKIRN